MRRADYSTVIDGRLVEVRRRRGYVEALIYAGDKAEGEPTNEWEMPNALRWHLETVAELAAAQSGIKAVKDAAAGGEATR